MSKINDLIKKLCPNGVEFKKIIDIAEVGTGSSNRQDAVEDGVYPFYVRSKEVFRINKFEYNEEAIIIPGEGGIGEIFHYVNGKYALHQRAYRIHIVDNRMRTKFLYYYMFNSFKDFIMLKAVNATVTSIRKPMIEQFRVPIPPIEVQEEIIRILDKFGELETELETELEARKSQYEFWRGKLLKGTRKYKLDDIAKFTYGFTDKALEDGTARYIRITDISETGYLLNDDCKYLNMSNYNSKYVLNKGDLVVARTGASYGKTLYFDSDVPGIYASFLIKIELDNNVILNRYYWHFSKSSLYWNQANNLVSKAGQPQFNSNAIKKIEIDLPSIEEQKRIITTLDKFEKLINDITEGIPAEIEFRRQQYEYYRNKLLNFEELTSE